MENKAVTAASSLF